MTNPNNIFNVILIWPILNVLVAFYKGFILLGVPGAFGFSIIAVTALIRLILYPLTQVQLKSAQKMNAIKPHIDKLSKLHKNDKMRLQQEQMKLYKEAGINPAMGCLPLLLQTPIIIALYTVLQEVTKAGDGGKIVSEINKIIYSPMLHLNKLDTTFFGFSLAHTPAEWTKYGWWLLLVPVLTGLLQYIQTRMMMPPPTTAVPEKNQEKLESGQKDGKSEKGEDMGAAMQKQMAIMMPLMIGFFAYQFPLGLSFYWNTFTVFGIIQQYRLNKHSHEKR